MTIAAQPAHDRLGDHFAGDGSIVAIAEHYRSVDSAPARYSVDRPAGVVNGFLLTFAGATAITMCLQMLLVRGAAWSDRRDLLVLTAAHGTALAPTRLFVVVFFLTYACYAYGNLWRRVALAGSLLGKFAVVCVLVSEALNAKDIIFDGVAHESLCRYPDLFARSFVVSSFGKTYHCTGWKIGYCVAPPELTAELRKVHQYLTFASFAPAQWLSWFRSNDWTNLEWTIWWLFECHGDDSDDEMA